MNKTSVIEKLLFCLILLSGAYFYHPIDYDNSSTRYFQISSIVDYGSLNIDNYSNYTSDTSYHDGHYYPNKAPGAPLLGVPVYWIIRMAKSSQAIPPLTNFDKYMIRLITTTLPFAILGILLFKIGNRWGLDPRKSLWMVLAYSLGSIAFQHATIFSGHQIAACFSFFSFYIIYSLSKKKLNEQEPYFKYGIMAFLAGLFAGLAALSDYTAIFIAMVLSVYTLLSHVSKREKTLFIFGGLLCLFALAAYNYTCFGSPLTLSYGHQVTEQFKEGSETGFFGISIPQPTVFLSILFSPARGLFFIMPVFLFSVFGWFRLYKNSDVQREMIVIAIIVAGYLLINSGFYGWHGGWIFGPRYLVPMLPFLALPMVRAPWDTKIFALLLCISIVQVGISIIGFPYTPEAIKNPIMELLIPCMRYGYFSKNFGNWLGLKGFWSALPIILVVSMCVFMMLRQLKQTVKTKEVSLILRAISLIWVSIIIIMLIFETTTPKTLIHENRAMLLKHIAITTKSRELYRNAVYELQLAKESF